MIQKKNNRILLILYRVLQIAIISAFLYFIFLLIHTQIIQKTSKYVFCKAVVGKKQLGRSYFLITYKFNGETIIPFKGINSIENPLIDEGDTIWIKIYVDDPRVYEY